MAKRISLILMGPPAVCECGPSGAVLARPHECPKMARSRPDILRDTETTDMMAVTQLTPEKVGTLSIYNISHNIYYMISRTVTTSLGRAVSLRWWRTR